MVGQIDLERRELESCRPATRRRRSWWAAGRCALPPGCQTRPWGLDFDSPGRSAGVPLGEDWSILCYTDGVIENERPQDSLERRAGRRLPPGQRPPVGRGPVPGDPRRGGLDLRRDRLAGRRPDGAGAALGRRRAPPAADVAVRAAAAVIRPLPALPGQAGRGMVQNRAYSGNTAVAARFQRAENSRHVGNVPKTPGTLETCRILPARWKRAENSRHVGNVPPQPCYPGLNHAPAGIVQQVHCPLVLGMLWPVGVGEAVQRQLLAHGRPVQAQPLGRHPAVALHAAHHLVEQRRLDARAAAPRTGRPGASAAGCLHRAPPATAHRRRPAARPGVAGPRPARTAGKCSGSSGPPRATMAACSRALRSSRTLPNHGCDCRKRTVCGQQRQGRGSKRRRKCSASGTMSSGRSRSGGRWIWKTFRRKNRSWRKLPLGHAARQVLVRRGQDADVERLRLVAADRQHLAVLQHAQQLDLHRQRDVGQLVEEDGAAVGQLEQAGPRLGRAGEGALDVAEQLALDQVRVEGGEVDRQERPVAARRCSGGWRGRPAPCRCRSRR